MALSVLTPELAQQLVQSEMAFTVSRIASIQEREGNPMGAEIRQFGSATAVYVREMPWGVFNTVKGLTSADMEQLEAIAGFYRERGRRYELGVDPYGASPPLFQRLVDAGLVQQGFHVMLYGEPAESEADWPGGITISEVVTMDDFDVYAAVHCLASGMPLSDKPHFVNNNAGLLGREGWRLFVAKLADEPAAVGAMYLHQGVASLALAATIPSCRNQGLQSALIAARIQEAYRSGCTLVAAQASFGSTSQHNMERAGLRLAWTRAVWGLRA